jgi:polysaccharide export outer membrane protein
VALRASLIAVFSTGILCGCHHTKPQYATLDLGARNSRPAALTPVSLTNKLDPAWLQPPVNLFTLGPGDRLEIELIGDPTSRTTTIVAPDGKIYFNLLPGIDVWGATLSQAKAMLENELSKFVREKPQLSIILRGIESKRVWVLGRVMAPGVYSMTTPMTVLEAVSMAGGTMSLSTFQQQQGPGITEELADLRHSFLLRQGKLMPVNFERLFKGGDLSQNIYLQPDDFIYMPAATARQVYVLGAVTQPQAVPYTEGLTVAGAVAGAFGTIRYAYMHHVAVVRGSLAEPQIAIVDYKRVIRGEAPDIALEPHDIVYVPFSPYRYIWKYAEIILNTFVSSAAINAGEAALNKQPTGGAGVFIPVGSGIQIVPPVTVPPIR